MGATVVAVLANGSRFSIGRVGDSRVYLFADGTLEQLTFDDSWTTVVAQDPSLNANDIAHHPMRNVLTSVFGARDTVDIPLSERSCLRATSCC
jgi:serine/threonine protein phosphatase PrpC